MPIEIREATGDDLAALARLRWECHVERHPADERDFDAYRLGFAQWWAAQQGRSRAIVAADGNELVGMGFVALVDSVPCPGSLDRRHGDIQSMYVIPGRRNEGVGTRIVEALLDVARRAGCERVEVHSGRRAVAFYERSGFEHFERLLNQVIGD
jgi:GNAT superfamily N-acetyltransferase